MDNLDAIDLTRHERRKQRTRNLIKSTALALLIEKGYEPLTIQDITDRLDLVRATFYVHFRDKDEVVWEVLRDHFDELNAQIRQLPRLEPHERHQQKILLIFEYAAQHRALLTVMLSERGHIRLSQRFAGYVAEIVHSDIIDGNTPSVDGVRVDFAAQFLAGALLQVLTWWLGSGSHEDLTPDQLAAMFSQLQRGS